MNSSDFLLGFLVVLLLTFAFGTWQARRPVDLLWLALGALVGFAVGQGLAVLLDWRWWPYGQLRLLPDIVIAVMALFLVQWWRYGRSKKK